MPRKGRPRGFPRITLRNITRAEPQFFAWLVTVGHRRKKYSRYFADGPDGPFESLRAAIAWRDGTWARVGAPSKIGTHPARGDGARAGVSLEVRAAGDRYVAEWPDVNGRSRRRRFSVNKYGRAKAKRLAIEARDAGVAATVKERHVKLHNRLHIHRTVLRTPAKKRDAPILDE